VVLTLHPPPRPLRHNVNPRDGPQDIINEPHAIETQSVAPPALAKGLELVVKPLYPRRGLPFKDTRHPGRVTEPMPFKSFIDDR
jgi:hypothetical protein